jgi:hypothetical protein
MTGHRLLTSNKIVIGKIELAQRHENQTETERNKSKCLVKPKQNESTIKWKL